MALFCKICHRKVRALIVGKCIYCDDSGLAEIEDDLEICKDIGSKECIKENTNHLEKD